MKKILFTTVAAAALSLGTLSSFAQGNVIFANQTTTAITFGTGTAAPGTKLTGAAGTYMFGLYVGPAGSQASALTLVGTGLSGNWPASSGLDGFFSVGNPYVLPNGYPGGTTIAFQVRGWTANLGNSYEAAIANASGIAADGINALGGVSALGSVNPITPPTLPIPPLFGTSGGGAVPGFALNVLVPEPSTYALGALGVGALALIRRRK
jgi:hypothetical protein